MKRLRNAWGAPRRAREPVCFHHKTPNAHREQLYGSPKAATQPSRLRSADGAFWGVLRQLYYRFALVSGFRGNTTEVTEVRNVPREFWCTKFSTDTKNLYLVLNQFRIHQIVSFCLAGAR